MREPSWSEDIAPPRSCCRAQFAICAVLLAQLVSPSQAYCDEVSLGQLSGVRVDANWFRYINMRFGVAVDIPTRGYRYEVPDNGDGLTLTSNNAAAVITVSAHWVVNLFEEADNDVQKSLSKMFDDSVMEIIQGGGTISYNVKRRDFYVISGFLNGKIIYERTLISEHCPAIYNNIRISYPELTEQVFDGLVTRMSRSLRATCQGEEGPARF